MITKECLDVMYQMFRKKKMLIRDDLLSCGFLSCDIKKLVDGGYITKDSHNHYIKDELNYFIYSLEKYRGKRKEEQAINKFTKYLIKIDKSIFLGLITNLVKISILTKDNSFNEVIIAIRAIEHGTFIFNFSYFKTRYYEFLTSGNIDVANLYLDILLASSDFGVILPKGLLEELKNIPRDVPRDKPIMGKPKK